MILLLLAGFIGLALAGTFLRIYVSNALDTNSFHYGTWAINIAGSFAAGLLIASGSTAQTLLAIGGLGSLTTYSGLTRETIRHCQNRAWWAGLVYLAVSVVAGVFAAWLGIQIGG